MGLSIFFFDLLWIISSVLLTVQMARLSEVVVPMVIDMLRNLSQLRASSL
jgi:hypothetical protein